jgi:prepilin-type N-terminal cleavage/methylation domain-containing protein
MAGSRLRRKEGFSLVEVLVALSILAVGLLALALFQVTAIKGNALASKWTIATQLSQDRLERFRHTSWANIVSSDPGGFDTGTMQPHYANLPGSAGDNTAVRGTTFYRVWYVNSPSMTLRTITVWTCWRDELSKWHNVKLATQRANVGGM